ncbi:MAG: arylsulfatase A-like enzyme, partial [Pseudohongiellaceae bacterium]
LDWGQLASIRHPPLLLTMLLISLRRWTRLWVCLGLAGFVVTYGVACGPGPVTLPATAVGARAPVVVLLLDTLRADHTGLGGGARPTPFLDGLAQESVVFERAYANASWTRPSVATLFTSRLPSSHGCVGRDGRLVDELVTLAEALQGDGYATRGVICNGNVVPDLGFGQGFDSYDHIPGRPYANAEVMGPAVLAALDVFETPERPGFLYIHYVDPHDPYHRQPDFDFAESLPGTFDGSRAAIDVYRKSSTKPDAAELARVHGLYDGEIAWLDARLAEVFTELDRRGILDQAWVVVTSDHGEGLWDHGVPGHGAHVYEEQIHVPLIIRPPGGLDAGPLRVSEAMGLLDLAPTLLDLVGVAIPPSFEGRSWAASLAGEGAAPERPVVIDERVDHFDMAAIIDGREKLIVDHTRQLELLFDLEDNPAEIMGQAVNLRVHRNRRGTELRRQLDEALSAAARSSPADSGGGEERLSAEVRRQLIELGYTGEDG